MRTPILCLLVIWPLLPLGACTMPNTGPGGDGPYGADLATPPGTDGAAGSDGSPGGGDGSAGLTCDDIKAQVTADLNASTSCTMDSDCTIAMTACGLPGQCGTYENKSWRTPQMDLLLKEWSADTCAPGCGCPQVLLREPACNAGVCGPKKTGVGVVGAACTQDSDCQTGQCLREADDPNYPGGYCTVKRCDKTTCPTGSACRGSSGGASICLADCAPMSPIPVCRKGYQCCSGPIVGGAGWCVPPNNALCLEV